MPALLLIVGFFGTAAYAAAVTFLPECADWYMRQAGTRLELRCRSTGTSVPPWLTIADCPNAGARRDQAGKTRISCNGRPSNTIIRP